MWGKLSGGRVWPDFYVCNLRNTILLKTNLFVSLLGLLMLCCNHTGSKAIVEDSLQYYPPTPTSMDKQEFRYYVRVLGNFFDSVLLDKSFNGGILIARNG